MNINKTNPNSEQIQWIIHCTGFCVHRSYPHYSLNKFVYQYIEDYLNVGKWQDASVMGVIN